MSIPHGRFLTPLPLIERSRGGVERNSAECRAAIERTRQYWMGRSGEGPQPITVVPNRRRREIAPAIIEVRTCLEEGCDVVMTHGSQQRCAPCAIAREQIRSKARKAKMLAKRAGSL